MISTGESSEFEEEHSEGGEDDSTSEEEGDDDTEDEVDEVLNFPCTTFMHMPCMAQTIQLVIKKAFAANSCSLLMKVKALVGHVRKSGVAVQMLLDICGKTLVMDNATRCY